MGQNKPRGMPQSVWGVRLNLEMDPMLFVPVLVSILKLHILLILGCELGS